MLRTLLRAGARGTVALSLALAWGIGVSSTHLSAPPAPQEAAPAAEPTQSPTGTETTAPSTSPTPIPTASPTTTTPAAVRFVTDPTGTPVARSSFRLQPTNTLFLVNKVYAIDPDYAPKDLVPITDGQQLRKEAAAAYQRMIAGAQRDGVRIFAISGYRSYAEQKRIFTNLHQLQGPKADSLSAPPGHSEHQLGLAIDVGQTTDDACHLQECFGQTAAGKWLAAHAAEYGYVVRYPAGGSADTGYRPEPWHVRYLGPKVSADLASHRDQTYEEWVAAQLGLTKLS